MEQVLRRLINQLSLMAREGRTLSYSKDAVGITALLYCPLKAEFRKQYPDIKTEAVEIDDGYLFEREVKKACSTLFGKRTLIEPAIPYESPQGVKIEGHPDIVIVGKEKILVLECKAPNFTFSSKTTEDGIIFCKNGQVSIPSNYLLQSRIQKHLVRNHFRKETIHYIFAKTLVRDNGHGLRKAYIFHETQTEATKEEIEHLIYQFLHKKEPRYHWECNYCPYKRAGICQGKTFNRSTKTAREIPEDIRELTEAYVATHAKLKEIEGSLKKAMPPDTHIEIPVNGKTTKIGWVTKTRYRWNIPHLFKLLGKEVFDYFMIKPRATAALQQSVEAKGAQLNEVAAKENVTIWKGI